MNISIQKNCTVFGDDHIAAKLLFFAGKRNEPMMRDMMLGDSSVSSYQKRNGSFDFFF